MELHPHDEGPLSRKGILLVDASRSGHEELVNLLLSDPSVEFDFP